MKNKAHALQQLLSLSQTMLEKAQGEYWEEVVVLEAARSELISLFFLEPIPEAAAQSVADGIQSILATDHAIAALAVLKKQDLAQTLQTMGQGKKALKAYTS